MFKPSKPIPIPFRMSRFTRNPSMPEPSPMSLVIGGAILCLGCSHPSPQGTKRLSRRRPTRSPSCGTPLGFRIRFVARREIAATFGWSSRCGIDGTGNARAARAPLPPRLRRNKPLDRLVGEAIEGGHAHLDMLFLRVLDLVVADAMQALDKHHDRRHAGARDFGGIVQRA